MAVIWGAAIAAIGAGIEGNENRKASKEDQRKSFEVERYLAMFNRRHQLEDRKYAEQAIGAYRGFGRPGLMSPQYTDPTTMNPIDPYAPRTRG